MKGKYLITTDDWFTAPDGIDYKAVWGEVEVIGDDVLGVKTNARSTNWYAKVGSEENHVIVAGCQIHYAVKAETKPKLNGGWSWEYNSDQEKAVNFSTPNKIYVAE